MLRYTANRLLMTIPTLLGVVTLVFIIMRLIPGDIVDNIIGAGDVSEEVRESLRAFFGLDRPIWLQYLDYLYNIVQLDFGDSWQARFPVTQLILQALPVTLQLAIMASLFSMAVGVAGGVLSAMYQGTLFDHFIRVVSLFSLAMPVFWQSTMLILILSLGLNWAPLGYVSPLDNLGQNLLLMLVPASALGTSAAASVMRMTRSCLLDVLRQDYVRTARAKGVRERAVVLRHALKNAMIPVVTVLGLQFGSLLGGAVVVEVVFGIPGLGLLTLNSISMRDYPVVQAAVLVAALMFIMVNLLVDLLYAYLDPRIRYS